MHDLRQPHSIYTAGYHGIFVKEDLISYSCFQITVEKMHLKMHAELAIHI